MAEALLQVDEPAICELVGVQPLLATLLAEYLLERLLGDADLLPRGEEGDGRCSRRVRTALAQQEELPSAFQRSLLGHKCIALSAQGCKCSAVV